MTYPAQVRQRRLNGGGGGGGEENGVAEERGERPREG